MILILWGKGSWKVYSHSVQKNFGACQLVAKLPLQHSSKLWKCESSGQGDPSQPRQGHLHPVGLVTQWGTQCAGVSLLSWEILPFLFLGSVSLCLPISAVAMGTRLYLSAMPGHCINICAKAFWISSSCVLSKGWSLWWLWGQGMDLVRFHKGREAHIILLEHQAPCQNRAALSSLSQLLLWMLILHVFLCLYTYISMYIYISFKCSSHRLVFRS